VNPVPVAVSVNAGPPAPTVEGDTLVSIRPDVMTNGRNDGVEPPVTPTVAVPGVISRVTGTTAVSCVEETTVVVRTLPLNVTAVPAGGRKPEPVTVIVSGGLPAGALFGVTLVIVTGIPVIEKFRPLVLCDPLTAVTVAVP